MQLRIVTQQIDLPAAMRSSIERRLRLAVGRHASSVGLLRTVLSVDDAGAVHCRVRVRLRNGEVLEIEDQADDAVAAAASAAWRLEHRLRRRRVEHALDPDGRHAGALT